MKRFDSKVVSKWIANNTGLIKRMKPKPFPGKAPTRIMLNGVINDKLISYIGKPSRTIYQRFMKLMASPIKQDFDAAFFVYVEFDRGGLITYTKGQGDRGPTMKTNDTIWTCYHPDLRVDSFPSWLRYDYKVIGGMYKIV